MKTKFISNYVLLELLSHATEKERLSITKLIDSSKSRPYKIRQLQEEISLLGGHGIVNLFRGEGTGYLDIVDEVADELKIKNIPSYSFKVKYFEEKDILKYSEDVSKQKGIDYAELVEEKIILKVLELIYTQLDKDKKIAFDKELVKVAKEFGNQDIGKLTGGTGLLILGNLGGFATYTFLTSAMSTLSMGVLGFGAYTSATTILGVLLGPVGWTALGLGAILSFTKPDYKKLIPIVTIIGTIRQRIKYESIQDNK